jgi:hypothetical protein
MPRPEAGRDENGRRFPSMSAVRQVAGSLTTYSPGPSTTAAFEASVTPMY